MDKDVIRKALAAMPVELVSNEVIYWVGQVMKKEGFDCKEWNDWAADDDRFNPQMSRVWWDKFDPADCKLDGRYIVNLSLLSGRLERGPGTVKKQGPEEDREDRENREEAEQDALSAEAAREDLRRAEEWEQEEETDYDGFPYAVSLENYRQTPPALPEPLIGGVLRQGHKMLLSGCSKAGKSFLLMELCVCIAEGRPWLGFPVKKGRVLYVNLEIDPASAVHRFLNIYKAMGLQPQHMADVELWNLRGQAAPMEQLTRPLIRRLREKPFDAVVIDPIYKVLTGDENSAGDMAAFCNRLDKVCARTGCSVIYCHHHSKGGQSGKKAIDRASGSGVFARDPDAILDVLEVETTEEQRRAARPGATAWRMESSLREFANIRPVYFWYEYPLHRRDSAGVLDDAPAADDGYRYGSADRLKRLNAAFDAVQKDGKAPADAMAAKANISPRTLRDWLAEHKAAFGCRGGVVFRAESGMRRAEMP